MGIQTQQAINNLRLAVESAGGTLEDIVILRIYIVQHKPENGSVISEILRKKFGTTVPPASTWISVEGLANADFLIEIEAQAVLAQTVS